MAGDALEVATVKRALTGIDQASIDAYAQRYVEYKETYKQETP